MVIIRSIYQFRFCLNHFSRACLSVNSEVNYFKRFSTEWLDEAGPFKALHSLNRLRVPLVVNFVGKPNCLPQDKLKDLKILDVGCGGGILSFPLARLGASVTAIDTSKEAIDSVNNYLLRTPSLDWTKNLKFECARVEEYSENLAHKFDVIIASEIIEHIDDVESFINACVKILQDGGSLLFTTINRTFLSKILAVWFAEEIAHVVPQGAHDWHKFVEPAELRRILEANNCSIRMIHGLTYNPFMNKWNWSNSTAVNYALLAVKKC